MSIEFPVVSAIQMVSSDDIARNMRVAKKLIIRAAKEQGATLLVLPENFLAMSSASQELLSQQIPFYLESLQEQASKQQVNIVAGSMPVPADSPTNSIIGLPSIDTKSHFLSASFLINAEGKICARYDKMHLFDVDVKDGQGAYRESDTYQAGSHIQIADMGAYKVGMSICYDLRFPGLFQKLVSAGADVIVLPAAFTKVTGQAHWEILLRARAIETQCFVIAANQGGKHSPKRETWGNSMIVDPWGRILAQCGSGEAIVSAKLDMHLLNEIRAEMPVQSHRREYRQNKTTVYR